MEGPLMSSHLFIGRRILSMASKSSSNEVNHTKEKLTRRTSFLQRILDHFWNRWQSIWHYLENIIAVRRELTLSIKCKGEMLYAYMTTRTQDSCGAFRKGSTFSSWSRGQSLECSSESETRQLPYFKIEAATAEALPLRSGAGYWNCQPRIPDGEHCSC